MRFTNLLLFVFIFLFSNLNAQVIGGSEEKLAKLYSLGKYETCLYKAEGLTFKEDYKKDAEPYLYMSMCFYKLYNSDDISIKEDFNDGFKNAIKFAAKFVKKDKEGEMYEDNIEFINLLKNTQFDMIKTNYNDEKYRKAAVLSKYYNRLNRVNDYSINYFIGVSEILSNNLSQGARTLDEATKQISIKLKNSNLKMDNTFKSLISTSCLNYSEYLVKEKKIEEALESLTLGKKMFPNDGYIEVQYNMIDKYLAKKKQSQNK